MEPEGVRARLHVLVTEVCVARSRPTRCASLYALLCGVLVVVIAAMIARVVTRAVSPWLRRLPRLPGRGSRPGGSARLGRRVLLVLPPSMCGRGWSTRRGLASMSLVSALIPRRQRLVVV